MPPLESLLSTISLSISCLHPNSVSSLSLLLDASAFTVEAASLKTEGGVGEAAAECDGDDNPCGGSGHVLNCCHKCSSAGPQRDHHSHSAISSSDALSLFSFHNCILTECSQQVELHSGGRRLTEESRSGRLGWQYE